MAWYDGGGSNAVVSQTVMTHEFMACRLAWPRSDCGQSGKARGCCNTPMPLWIPLVTRDSWTDNSR